MKIGIDPGHGGNDPGAVGLNGLQEKPVTLAIANIIADLLKAKGINISDTHPRYNRGSTYQVNLY